MSQLIDPIRLSRGRLDKSNLRKRRSKMSKKLSVILGVAVLLLMSSVLWACPQKIPEFEVQYLTNPHILNEFIIFRPGYPENWLSLDYEIDLGGQDAVTYTWNWGDGSSNSTGTIGYHTYNSSGSFLVTVTCSDAAVYDDDEDVVKQFYVVCYPVE
jgi:hypothetical protein